MTACTICPDRLLRPLLPLAFWLVVWQLAALAVGQSFILPGPAAVLGTLIQLAGVPSFWQTALLSLVDRVGVPAELLPLMLVRPISGSAALGVGAELITSSGPDSYVGRVAAVMLGSTETTFYTIAVYFGAVGISRTRYAVPAALCADLTGFLAAAWAVRLCFGGG